jgi:hypothetical protein
VRLPNYTLFLFFEKTKIILLTIFPAVSGPTPRIPVKSALNTDSTREGWLTGAKALAPAIAVKRQAIFMISNVTRNCQEEHTRPRKRRNDKKPPRTTAAHRRHRDKIAKRETQLVGQNPESEKKQPIAFFVRNLEPVEPLKRRPLV